MSTKNITSLFLALGIDSESYGWEEIASCKNAELNWFFDIYEENKVIAEQVDNMCASCPAMQECFNTGISEKRTGVWGGFFMTNGKVDPVKNKHKTEHQARLMAGRIYG